MDSEHVPGEYPHVGEILPPPPADVPQAGSHFPLEIVPDIHPSVEKDIPPRQLLAMLTVVVLLFGWRPLSAFGTVLLSTARLLPSLARQELALVTTSIEGATHLIHQQDAVLSERIASLSEKTHSLVVHTQTSVSSVGEDVDTQLASLSSGVHSVTAGVSSFFDTILLWLRNVWNSISAKWNLFLSGSDSNAQALTDAKEELKAQLRAEILSSLQASSSALQGGGSASSFGQEGIIVLPKTSAAEANRIRQEAVQGVFSDKVMVTSDETGRSGVIRPIFRSGVGEDYLYVMVPVSNQ
ncbi:MAG: hypothetical protein NUV65_00985 [Candidatus Roizmanbacteria bacterium]|nr:hypothetical protein [Candidatus Roizmanbacteria bacterium]